MAIVRITAELKRQIDNKIENDFRPVNDKHDASFKLGMLPADICEIALTSFLKTEGVSRETFDSLPESWKSKRGNISIVRFNDVEVPYSNRRIDLPNDVLLPVAMGTHNSISVNDEAFEGVAANIRAWREESQRIHAEQAAFKQGVHKVLAACTTLKQAVEMWPNMIEVVPESVKQTHLEPQVRQKKQKIEVDADLTDALNSTLVGTKISKVLP